ncbi:MAG: hypothetical protein Aurels2KO_55590 [Aureliella sp.]
MVSDPARRQFLHTMAEFSNSEWQFTASGEFSAQLKLLSDGQSVDQVGRWRQLSPTEFIGSTSLAGDVHSFTIEDANTLRKITDGNVDKFILLTRQP